MGLLTGAAVMVQPEIVDAQAYVNPYARRDGMQVEGHYRSAPDGDPSNNYSYPAMRRVAIPSPITQSARQRPTAVARRPARARRRGHESVSRGRPGAAIAYVPEPTRDGVGRAYERMEMHVEIDRAREALKCGDGAGLAVDTASDAIRSRCHGRARLATHTSSASYPSRPARALIGVSRTWARAAGWVNSSLISLSRRRRHMAVRR